MGRSKPRNPFEWIFTEQGTETINEILQGTENGTLVWHAARSRQSKRTLCRKTIKATWCWAQNFPGYNGPGNRCSACQEIIDARS